MNTITCPCTACGGTGRVTMSGMLADTYALVCRQGGEVCGADLARLVECSVPAMCNRLAALERKGLLVSRRDGVRRLYRTPAVPSI